MRTAVLLGVLVLMVLTVVALLGGAAALSKRSRVDANGSQMPGQALPTWALLGVTVVLTFFFVILALSFFAG